MFLALIALTLASAAQSPGSERKLTFADEFNGPGGTAADPNKWSYEVGGGGWGNKELQYYTDSTKNAHLDGIGNMVIRAAKLDARSNLSCWYGPCEYTSARLITKGKFEQKYGRFEARIKIPQGQGMWSAFWMLGNDIDKVGWASCGEIDIMENIGKEPNTIHGTIHGPDYSGDKSIGAQFRANKKFADDFHVFATEWSENKIEFFVDGKRYKTTTPKDLPKGRKWVFDHPFFLLLNFAIGGPWGGNPDHTSVFPQEMLIDYVRVYEP
jgi:beta-glucanase (GH16 family)